MDNTHLNVLSTDAYIIYLRKSRADNPSESVEEVLEKHEAMLQELAERDLGGRIPDDCIFREVVSGETIEERPEMSKVLSKIENPDVRAVLVVDPQRLSRGDLMDCGQIVNAFRYTKTEIITMNMTYDLTNKMQRKFFEQELVRGNDFLEYTKEILLRGRIASVKRGSYIGNTPPFGYDKIKDEIGPTLIPNEQAEAVKMAFDLYVNEGRTFYEIGRYLDSIGVKPMKTKRWDKTAIRWMLQNHHYAGFVRFGFKHTVREYVDGQIEKRRSRPGDPDEMIIIKGRHTALVSEELFNAAQEKMDNNPRAKRDAPLQNPLAGLFYCAKCGKAMIRHPYKRAQARYSCKDQTFCESRSIAVAEIVDAVRFALLNEKLPELEAKLKNNDGNAAAIQKKQIEKMNAELGELLQQENKQYDLLEKGIYSEDVFTKRNKKLHAEIEELKSRIFTAKQTMPVEIDYKDKIIKLQTAIEALTDESLSALEKNKLLKTIIKRIEYDYIRHEGKGKIVYELNIFLLL